MSACAQPGCSGVIEEGYCNVCGMVDPSSRGGTVPMVASAAAQVAPVVRDVSASMSARTGSSPTGRSARSARSTRSVRSTRSSSSRSGRTTSRLLGGLPITRPPLPPLDPLASIVPGEVPDRKRYCSNCDSKLNREAGFCPKCGQEYSFKPTLQPGDLVAEKYEIQGTIAFGGLGWIYLALDTVLSRWVILKGLLNSKDPRMLEVAVKEREYLAAVKHPSIVSIYDFLTHGSEGFIVMEYVNGKTLMTLRKERGGPLPVAEAISYILEILPAFGYLDEVGMVYCDFKPENAMVEESTVKLIDLGAVRQVDDLGGDIYGSRGYTAPEAGERPSHQSDLYTVARALAVLVADFDFQGKYEHSLPIAQDIPAFSAHEPLYRFLQKATRPNPDDRFQCAADMIEQLVGVLRHVVPAGTMGPIESALFDRDSDHGPDSGTMAADVMRPLDGIPRPKADPSDAASAVILAAGAIGDPSRRLAMFERALKNNPDSIELKLRRLDELIVLGRSSEADTALLDIQKTHPKDWRLLWYRGRALLAEGNTKETLKAFEKILDELPGELAPKQAIGRAYELSGQMVEAAAYYDSVSKADPTFTSAAFGLGRCLERQRDRAGAADAYRRVSPASSRYVQAQMALGRVLVNAALGPCTLDNLRAAGEAIQAIDGLIDGLEAHLFRATIFEAAAVFSASHSVPPGFTIAGLAVNDKTMREAAETELRRCARMAAREQERIDFVDRANQVRPFTFL
ncbi:MAG: tetratricopeptide repeat protein [Polyangiaceae bacterium]